MVTACLITHSRQQNMGRIVQSLLNCSWIDEILIWDNSRHENVINYGRYLLAAKARNDFIYTQDDDAEIKNLDELYQTHLENQHVITHTGVQEYLDRLPAHTYKDRQSIMVGWGAIFNKEWIKVLKRYTDKYGEDYCFYRETDRIFSILMGGHHKVILGNIEHLDGYKNENALSSQLDHIKYKELAIQRCLELVS